MDRIILGLANVRGLHKNILSTEQFIRKYNVDLMGIVEI